MPFVYILATRNSMPLHVVVDDEDEEEVDGSNLIRNNTEGISGALFCTTSVVDGGSVQLASVRLCF